MTKSKRRNSFCVPSLPPLGSNNNNNNANANTSNNNNNNNKTNNDRPPLPPHFLRNINLNDGNLLDIPDPPSPTTRRNNPRRQSSPMMLPRPLRDVTNGESDDEHTASARASSSVTTTGKRSRKSLCHVPSPATETTDNVNDEPVVANDEPVSFLPEKTPDSDNNNNNNEEEAKTPSICFDDDDDIVVSSSKRQKRRESMILPRSDMAPLPMDETSDDSSENADETNNEMNIAKDAEVSAKKEDTALELDDGDDGIVSSKRTSRRLSIVLPCNIASFEEEVANQEFGASTRDTDSLMKDAVQQDALQDNDDALPIKRRQSMVLPSDASLLENEEEAKEYFGQLQMSSQQAREIVASSPPEQDSTSDDTTITSTNKLSATDVAFSKDLIQGQVSLVAHQGDGAALDANASADHIRNLVREYCSLPLSERNMSKQAEDIERLTGYALVPPTAKQQKLKEKSGIDLNWTGSPHNNDETAAEEEEEVVTSHNDSARAKRELLLKLGAMVDLMDKRKTEDAKQMETSTGCRFHRSRSGKYRYYHLSFNRKTSPAHYQKLYLATVKQSKAEMSKRIQDWLRQSENSSDMSEDEIHEQCVQLSALVESAQQQKPVAEDETGLMEASPLNDPEQPEVDRSASESDMEESPASDSSELESKDSNSPPLVVVDQAKGNAQARNEAGAMEKDDTSTLSLTDTSLEVDTTVSPTASSDSNISSDANESSSAVEDDELLLPLPSRDEASDDPAIAAAEQRLWSEIDAALERYSSQVVAIRKARASEQDNN